jgi:hypothetical protein
MESREELLSKLGDLVEQDEEVFPVRTRERSSSKESPSVWDPMPEFAPRPYVQPENDPRTDPASFKVGDFYWNSKWSDGHLERQAIPYPQWPRPGQVATDEEKEVWNNDFNLWMLGSRELEHCIRRWKVKILRPDDFVRPENGRMDEGFAHDWTWLTGIWNAKGLSVPSDEQLTAWAMEGVTSQTEQAKSTPATSSVSSAPVQKPFNWNDANDPRHPQYGRFVNNAPR